MAHGVDLRAGARILQAARLTACGGADYRVCRNDNECASNGACRKVQITSSEGVVEMGVCL